VPPAKSSTIASSNWAGHALLGSEIHSVYGEWTQPTVDCSNAKPAHAAFWVGLDGVKSHSVEQLGTAAECKSQFGTRTDYYAWWEMYPQPMRRITLQVRPGDRFSASVDATGPTTFKLSITNLTTGRSFNTNATRTGSWPTSAEWIVEPTALCNPTCAESDLARFDGVTFSNVEADAKSGPVALETAPKLLRFDLRSGKGRRHARVAGTSVLRSAEDGFYVVWIGPA
jgi:hypothetical protein